MKIIIDSKCLASELKKVNFSKHQVLMVESKAHDLIISFTPLDNYPPKKPIVMQCAVISNNSVAMQLNARWDWVRSLLKSVDSQPVVLDITENHVKVIFEY